MIERHGHFADLARRFAPGDRLCTAMATLLMLAFLSASSAVSAGVVTASRTPSGLESPEQLDAKVLPTGAARAATNRSAHRPSLQKGTLLVASRYLADPNFARAVVLLVDHGAHGAMGLIINRPTRVSLDMVFPEVVPPLLARHHRLYIGGPVAPEQVTLLLRSDRQLQDAAHVFADIFFSVSEDRLRQLLSTSPERESFHAYVGYAGWGPGQLEDEVGRGDWHLVSPDSRTVFDAEPSEIWHELLRENAGLWVRRSARPLLSRYTP